MAKGIDITGQGINFLITIEGTEALKFLKTFEKNFQNVERSVDTVVQQIGSAFDRITNAMEEYIEELNENPNMVGPGGATSKQMAGMEKVRKTIEATGKLLQEQIKGATQETGGLNQNVQSLAGSLDRASDEAKDLENALGEAATMGDKLKEALAFAGAAVGIGALVQETIDWNRQMVRAEILLRDTGMTAKGFHDEIMRLSKATATSADEIADLERSMLDMGITDERVRGMIIEHGAKMAKMFDVDRDAMTRFYAELHNKNIATVDDLEGLSSALVRLSQIGLAADLPGNMQGDMAAIQARIESIQKFRQFGRARGMGEEQVNEASQRLMMQIPLMQRALQRGGADPALVDRMLALPERFAEEGGQRARGFLAAGFQGIGMQANPEQIVKDMVEGRLDKVMPIFEKAIEKMAASPQLVERVPQEFLGLLMGDLAGQDPKALIAQIDELRRSGHSVAEAMAEIAPQLEKARQEQLAFNEEWENFKKSIAGTWDLLTANVSVVMKRFAKIAEGPIQLILQGLLKIVEYTGDLLEWIENNNTALRITQTIIFAVAAAPILKLATAFRFLWRAITASKTAAEALGKVLPGLGKWLGAGGSATTVAGAATTTGTAAVGGAEAVAGSAAAAGAKGAATAVKSAGTLAKEATTAATKVGPFAAGASKGAEAARAGMEAASEPGIFSRLWGGARRRLGLAPTTMAEGAEEAAQAARAATNPSLLTRAGRGVRGLAGRAGGPLALIGAGMTARDEYNRIQEETKSTGQAVGGAVGSGAGFLAGAGLGAKVGAGIGTFIAPGIGTAVGGVLGGAVGGMAGAAMGSSVGQNAMSLIFPSEATESIGSAVEKGAREGAEAAAQKSGEVIGAKVAEEQKRERDSERAAGAQAGGEAKRSVEDAIKKIKELQGSKDPKDIAERNQIAADLQRQTKSQYERGVPLGEQWKDVATAQKEAGEEEMTKAAVKDRQRLEQKMLSKEAIKRKKEMDEKAAQYEALGMPGPDGLRAETLDKDAERAKEIFRRRGSTPQKTLLEGMEGMELPGMPRVATPKEIEYSKKYGLRRTGLPEEEPMKIGDERQPSGLFLPKGGVTEMKAPEVNVQIDQDKVVDELKKTTAATKQLVEEFKTLRTSKDTYKSFFHRMASEHRS